MEPDVPKGQSISAPDPELTLDGLYHPRDIGETSITYCRSQNRMASTTHPSALVPVPGPKPCPRFGYFRYSTSVPALRSAAIRRSIAEGGAIPSCSPTATKVGGSS